MYDDIGENRASRHSWRSHRPAQLLLALFVAFLLFAGASPMTRAHASSVWFNGYGVDPYAVFGANATVTISGDLAGGCIDQFGDFSANVYVVSHGSINPQSSTPLSNSPNAVIISQLNDGLFDGETIGFTGPNGHLGPGDYDVVLDVCSDQQYEPGVDLIAGVKAPHGAFTVAYPANIPPLPQSPFAAVKADSQSDAQRWTSAAGISQATFAMYDLYTLVVSDILTAGSTGELLGNFYLDWICTAISPDSAIKDEPIPITPYCPTEGPVDLMRLEFNVVKLELGEAAHYQAIANDPADPNYMALVSLDPTPTLLPNTTDPFEAAFTDLGTQTGVEGAALVAMLHALEKYQGAQQADDGASALLQAQAIQQYATLAAQQVPATNTLLGNIVSQVNNGPRNFGQESSFMVNLLQRLQTSGFTPGEVSALESAGLSSGAIQELLGIMTESAAHNPSANYTLDSYQTLAPIQNTIQPLQASESQTASDLRQLASAMGPIISGLQSQLGDPMLPTANAAGPYSGTTGAPLTFNASASSTPPNTGALTYAWDLLGNDTFADATGPSPSFTFTTPRSGMVGVKVTNAAGKSAVAYAPLTITASNQPPTITALNPAGPVLVINPGTAQTFSATVTDPENDPTAYQWQLDGTTVSSAATYTRTFTSADEGLHTLRLTVSDPGGSDFQPLSVLVPAPLASAVTLAPATQTVPASSSVTATATAMDASNAPLPGVRVTLTITGANPAMLTATANASGVATFAYSGAHGGVDTLVASSGPATSQPATVQWAAAVSGVNPGGGGSSAPCGGQVTVTGAGFTGATAVLFGSEPSPGFSVSSDTTILAYAPAGSGTADVTVITPAGSSQTQPVDHFSFTTVSDRYTAGPGYAVHDFATCFAYYTGLPLGPFGVAVDAAGNVFAVDNPTGVLYKFGPAGGTASQATRLNTTPYDLASNPAGLVFDQRGHLYMAMQYFGTNPSSGKVVELSPTDGSIIRTIADHLCDATGLAIDPISGDLFVSQFGCGPILRLSNFTSGPATVTSYTDAGTVDGLAFGPDGTLYADQFLSGPVIIAGTNARNAGATLGSVFVPNSDGVALLANTAAPAQPPFLFVNTINGSITKVDLTTPNPTLTNVMSGGSRGLLMATDPNGCVYAAQTDRVLKIGNADGSCANGPGLVPPTVNAVSLASGFMQATCGATAVITGNGFLGATAVKFGNAPAFAFTVISNMQMTAYIPAGSGVVDVTITTPAGISTIGPGDQFTIQSAGDTFTAASGFVAQDYAKCLPFTPPGAPTGLGPIGVAFDAAGDLYVGDYLGLVFKVAAGGGTASPATLLSAKPFAQGSNPAGLTFDKRGHLYMALKGAGTVVEISPSDGSIIRTIASGLCQPTALATDPLSGDLFVSHVDCGGISRLSGFATGPATVTTYGNIGAVDGFTFGPDGTLDAALFNSAARIAGTNQPNAGAVTAIATVSTIDGIAVGADPANPSQPPFLFANRNDGTITKIDLSTSTPALTNILTGGSRGDFVAVGPDGCLYATQTDRVLRVTNADGSCSLAPTSV
ncbi:MAG: PKD domain-containing protein, partial [Dehalococcoidia bacterium]